MRESALTPADTTAAASAHATTRLAPPIKELGSIEAGDAAGAAAAAATGAAHNGGRPVRASSDFARVFSALARARDDAALDDAGAGPVRLVDPAAFDALLRRCGAGE